MKGSFFKEKFKHLAMRKPRKKALIAIARKLLVVIWNVLKYAKEYNPKLVPVQDPVKMKVGSFELYFKTHMYYKIQNCFSNPILLQRGILNSEIEGCLELLCRIIKCKDYEVAAYFHLYLRCKNKGKIWNIKTTKHRDKIVT